ncbi:helix-turn-helix domain-containing protein [Anaerobacillus isosaccharinicus]|uniref:Helix-turn-helix domain-containing protein n=1 Tax=Anaerobacillus isosaccharinicus TaxID=1532552 RepID=A0A7S7RBW6_9BACI|nr:helix-turn-helix transcriptional regulator [Anaerobacillus isosaccharinicus]MBA5585243.1 helix-turn-helix transcriptional regulator [Anaerobacillus isosaccharinicus]QOY36424.1 helix-turn-helix transcriptional regulator [Anaerobacillus isosaccharinicus]
MPVNTRSTYSGYEKGVREAGYVVLIRLAKLFDVSVDYLLGLTEKPKYKMERNVYKVLYSSNLHWNGIPIEEGDLQPIRTMLENILNARAKN